MKNFPKSIPAFIFICFIFFMAARYILDNISYVRIFFEGTSEQSEALGEIQESGHDVDRIINESQNPETIPGLIEEAFNSRIYRRMNFIELYGSVQHLLGKRQIEDFTYVLMDYDKLTRLQPRLSQEEIRSGAENIALIRDFCDGLDIPVFYMTSLLPVVEESDLPYGICEYSHQNAADLERELQKRDIEIIDLRTLDELALLSKEEIFYRTDHHWTIEACFATFGGMIREINERSGLKLDPAGIFRDIDSYTVVTNEDDFLGSYGVKVGKYYIGEDDFVYYVPDFDTDFRFEAYDESHQMVLKKDGTFTEALIDLSKVNDPDYINKYLAFLYGYRVEERVTNRFAENDLKALLISHSYGMPLMPFLSLCFEETRYLDPQEGHYNDNFLDYIQDYDPDVVLILTEFEGYEIHITTE